MKKDNSKKSNCFSVFNLWDLKLVPNDSESALNSTSGNLTYFFKYVGVVPRKAAKF